jgi:hypothetical protein
MKRVEVAAVEGVVGASPPAAGSPPATSVALNVGLEKQGAAFGAGIASPAVNIRESDMRVADASRIAERSASDTRYARMLKVNLNGFRVASSVEHPDNVESFVAWDRSRQLVAASPSRRHAAPNVATLRTNRAQSHKTTWTGMTQV